MKIKRKESICRQKVSKNIHCLGIRTEGHTLTEELMSKTEILAITFFLLYDKDKKVLYLSPNVCSCQDL